MIPTATAPSKPIHANGEPEPTWEIAYLFPAQGYWSEEEYLALDTNKLVEFTDGTIEVISMPSQTHQFIVFFLQRLLWAYVTESGLGTVLGAPLRVQIRPGKYREPDIVFMLTENDSQRGEQYWQGADLIVEVVSPDDPARDYETKRREYAEAAIREYWIVDPQKTLITVLTLIDGQYSVHGEFTLTQQASSVLLQGFAVDVSAVFAAAK